MNKVAYLIMVLTLIFAGCASGNTVRKDDEFVSAQTLPSHLIKSLKKDRQIKEDMAICKVMNVKAGSFMSIRKTGNYCVTDRDGKKSLWIKKTYVEELVRKGERKKQRRKKARRNQRRNQKPRKPAIPAAPASPTQPAGPPPAASPATPTSPPPASSPPATPAPAATPDPPASSPPAKPAPTSTGSKTPV